VGAVEEAEVRHYRTARRAPTLPPPPTQPRPLEPGWHWGGDWTGPVDYQHFSKLPQDADPGDEN